MASIPVLTAYAEPNGIDETARRMWLRGKLAFPAGTYAAGGALPSYQPILDSTGAAVLLPVQQNGSVANQPLEMALESDSGSGYQYAYIPATGKVKILECAGANAPLEELAAGALPGGVTSDAIHFVATWQKD